MVTDYATSADGKEWTWHGTALNGRPGHWDSRGTRVTAVMHTGDTIVAYYDGRASAAENYEERTGIATGTEPDRARPRSGDAPPPSRPTAAAACATWTSCRSATAATGCTTR